MAPRTPPHRTAAKAAEHPQADALTTKPRARAAKAVAAVAAAKSTIAAVANKPSFKQQMLLAREVAIIDVVNRMLSDKGFDAMTVDEVAAQVGVAKASLYKHFPSKEDLAAAAMVRVVDDARAFLATLDVSAQPLAKLKAVARWMMQRKLAGQMPNLPSQNSSLRATLIAHKGYVDGLMQISDSLGGWIEAAQKAGQINPKLPAIVVLYTLYARACDPVLEFLKASGQYSDAQMLDLVTQTCFDGLVSSQIG
jgi:TetR/AcrR family transcriptional regulator, regulator of autoinduction and epiphytic fitness